MSFTPKSGLKYTMPVVFGPTSISDETVYDDVHIISISYRTTVEAAERLVPHHLQVRQDPIVTISRIAYENVDYLGGRGYAEVTVGITTRHVTESETVNGLYMPVVWLDDAGAMTAGREFLGYAKVFGDVPTIKADDAGCSYELLEYGNRLLTASVSSLRRLEENQLDRVRRASRATTVLGWKYIPASEDGADADADYITHISLEFDLRGGLEWRGRVVWELQDALSAPFSSRAVAALDALPVISWRPAFIGHGPGRLFRGATRRLSNKSSSAAISAVRRTSTPTSALKVEVVPAITEREIDGHPMGLPIPVQDEGA